MALVRLKICQSALKNEDYESCFLFCDSLMTNTPLVDISSICLSLAEAEGFKNIQSKLKCLSYALYHLKTDDKDAIHRFVALVFCFITIRMLLLT
jgi:hypothetical protein